MPTVKTVKETDKRNLKEKTRILKNKNNLLSVGNKHQVN